MHVGVCTPNSLLWQGLALLDQLAGCATSTLAQPAVGRLVVLASFMTLAPALGQCLQGMLFTLKDAVFWRQVATAVLEAQPARAVS